MKKRIKTGMNRFLSGLTCMINFALHRYGKHLQIVPFHSVPQQLSDIKESVADKIRLNIGSGGKPFDGGWINLDYPNDYFKDQQSAYGFIPYDIRFDRIPFNDNSVDLIYCSHVIEHIENCHVQKLFQECYRVMKQGGILRIACPDAEFLYQLAKSENDYWKERYLSVKSDFEGIPEREIRNVDFLVREIATQKLYKYITTDFQKDYSRDFDSLSMNDFFDFIIKDLKCESGFFHINYWTFDKAYKMLFPIGYAHIIRSKHGACCSIDMRDTTKFDTTSPTLSLYVDAIK